MSDDKRARLKQWLTTGEVRLEPLTFSQRELWETSPVPPSDASHHIACLLHIKGAITPHECEAAIQRVVNRQEALRTTFIPGKDRPLQMVKRTGEANFALRDLSANECSSEAIEEIAAEIYNRPFDLVQGPLHQVTMCRRSETDMVLVFSIHHALADGWTLGVFVQDLVAAYLLGMRGATGRLPPVPMTYAEWGATERATWMAAELDSRAAFWKTQLAGTRRIWSDRPRPIDARGRPLRWRTELPPALGTAVRELARKQGATLYSTLLACFQIAFNQWTGVSDLVVGTPIANRSKKAVHETMGYCSGVVPVRGQVNNDEPFTSHLKAVHQSSVESFGNAMPFAELVKAVGDLPAPGYNPIFEVRFALQNHPIPEVSLANLSAKLAMRSTGTPRLDLACEVTEDGDAMEIVWLYRAHLFALEEIKELNRIFENVISGACRSPESRAGVIANTLS